MTKGLIGRTAELEQIGQALRRADLVGAVLAGAPGSGTSTLLEAAAAHAAEQGFEVVRLHANRATSAIPLFVFSPLLGAAGDAETAERFMAVRAALRERARHRPILLAIDDAHELDDASAALISQLARELTAFVVVGLPAGAAAPAPIAGLWTQGLAVRIDVAPLARDACSEVAAAVLGGLLDPALEAEVWRRTSGNPLHIRELLLGSRAAGALVHDGQIWSRRSELVTSDALVDLVNSRVGALDPEAQVTLCAVALAEPAGVSLIEAVAHADSLVRLEEAGLVKVHTDRRRLSVTIAHPLYGEAVLATTSRLRVRELRRALAAQVTAWGSRRLDDTIQVATWRLDAHDTDTTLFATAAFEAIRRHDIDLAERLATAAHEAEPNGLTARALAMTRHLLGRHRDALEVLDAALATGLSVAEAARVRLLQGLVLARGEGEYPEAIDVLRHVDTDAPQRVRDQSQAMLALIALLEGRAADSLAESTADGGAPLTAESCTARVGSMAVTGRPAEALRLADDFVAANGEPDPRTLFLDFRWVAMIDAGAVDRLDRELGDRWDAAIDSGDRHFQARLAFAMGHARLDKGQVAEAIAWFDRSAVLSRSIGERFGVRWALCGRLLAAGQTGDRDAAARATAALADVPGHPAQLFEIYGQRGAAWALAAEGRSAQAADDLLELAVRLITAGCVTHAVRTLVDAARLGAARRAQEIVSELTVALDGDLMPRCVQFIDALNTGDEAVLDQLVGEFEQIGYGGFAGAAAMALREVHARKGRTRDARSVARRLEQLPVETAAVPGLMLTDAPTVVPLTRREREIAHLVSLGRSSKEVAEACFVSVRTVDNHLARIYDKLGVRSRGELAEAIRPLLIGELA